MEPIVVAAIGALGGLVSGLVVALVKPVGEDWQEHRRETRKRRLEDLDRMADAIRQSSWDPNYLRIGAASLADPALIEYVGRYITASTEQDRAAAQGDASHRIGELRSSL